MHLSGDHDPALTHSQRLRFATVLVGAFLVMLLAATCGACAAFTSRNQTSGLRTPVAQYASAVAIHAHCATSSGQAFSGAVGTGVAISDTLVLTAHHVIALDGLPEGTVCKLSAMEGDGSHHPLELDADMPSVDLARLRLTGDDRLTVAGDYSVEVGPKPAVGDTICAVGVVPFRSRFCGQVQWHPAAESDGHDIDHSVITNPGNSGGPIYDARGRLVGITTKYFKCPNGQFCGGFGTSLSSRAWLLKP